MLNIDNELIREKIEEDMDFKIQGLPHSTVKQLQSANVRELIQKIENHPNRHALQRDPQQSQSFNPFSQESKQMIHEGEDRIESDTSPVQVSHSVGDRSGQPDETTIERGNPLESEIPWLQEFRENVVDDEIPVQ